MSARKPMPIAVLTAWLLCVFVTTTTAQPLSPNHVDDFAGKPRLVVLTDMGNEPDDQAHGVPT
ncbi:MAG: hypothetical protein JNK38_12155 [Acidobacteria bacterium]|nr:hypothetical protein [Acidobacteriota bacterium]